MLGDKIEIETTQYNELLFRKRQWELVCKLVDSFENQEIDNVEFYDELLNIL